MFSKSNLRRQWFVDSDVQGALVWRAILYWCACLGTMTLMLLCWGILTGPSRLFYYHFNDMWFYYGPALIVSVIILPLVIVDIVRLSNRFAGPLVRLRRSMRALARGEHVRPIRFRDDDFWRDFAEEFNAVVARVQGETTDRPDPGAVDGQVSESMLVSSNQVDAGANLDPSTGEPMAESVAQRDEEEKQLHTVGSNTD